MVAPLPNWDTTGVALGASCAQCRHRWRIDDEVRAFRRCCVCGCTRFYRQKMFPRWLGIGIVVVGAVASIGTYGLSLVAAFLIDLMIFRSIPEMAVCYQCRAELRGIRLPAAVLPFRHHLAEGYESRRNKWLSAVADSAHSRRDGGTAAEQGAETGEKADSLTAASDSEHDSPGS